ncbi:MAG: RNA polymerase sigma factor [Polyangiaceae bacterium]|nr:RNA polymerase sigma factor [Polyangiaceae bacterium]
MELLPRPAGSPSAGPQVTLSASGPLRAIGGTRLTASGSSAALARVSNVRSAEVDEIVERAKKGDKEAFRELFRRHRADVARLAYRMLGSATELEDVVQEVFLQVHKSLGDFRGQSKFSTWLHRVTVNVVLMNRRAARSRPVFAAEALSENEPDAGVRPDDEAARRRRLDAFRRVLDRLPEKKRTVFVLHEIEGLAPAEISTIVDAPVLTVRTRLFYARREICELMREEPSLIHLCDEIGRTDRSAKDDGAKEEGGVP